MWIRNESTRRWLYTIAIAVVPLLTIYGVIQAEHGALWLGIVGAVLSVGAPLLARANTSETSARHADPE